MYNLMRKWPSGRCSGHPTPKEKFSVREKFERPWAPIVLDSWTGHLGEVVGQDPTTFRQQDLPSWSSTLKLVKELNIPAFKTGLTAMQMVNMLSYWNVIWKASIQLGAVAGLELLGFRTNNRDRIQAVYICCHYFLNKHLTDDDKKLLGFDTAFTEHDLCKVPQWNHYVGKRLVQIATQLQQTGWTAGVNCTDCQAMPFPVVTKAELQLALNKEESYTDNGSRNKQDEDSNEDEFEGGTQTPAESESETPMPEFEQGSSKMRG
ncbi:hypothetical protein C8R46DRAFT_1045713 [Mycena filopes]|nr:hypothetical protein C8R46DRAFT_1045713 [Mycena filopes]